MKLSQLVRAGSKTAFSLLAIAACFLVGPAAQAKSGGGLTLEGGGVTRPVSSPLVGVGGEGVFYMGPFLRTGVDIQMIRAFNTGGIKGGVFGDFVFGHVANADIFLGAGLGLAGGDALGGGPDLYARPEFGVQWNLGRIAIEAKLNATLLASLTGDEPASSFGLSVGLLFGDFMPGGVLRGGGRERGRDRYREAPGPRRAPQPRYAPPPPPPPRY